jgi:hypothetical protein
MQELELKVSLEPKQLEEIIKDYLQRQGFDVIDNVEFDVCDTIFYSATAMVVKSKPVFSQFDR